MVGQKDAAAGVIKDRAVHLDLGQVEIEHIAPLIKRRTAKDRQITSELADRGNSRRADEAAVAVPVGSTGEDQVCAGVGREDFRDVEVVGQGVR